MKPFLYALAIDEGIAAPESKIPDVPLYFQISVLKMLIKILWIDWNERSSYKSLNIPFVLLLKEYKDDKFSILKEVLDFKTITHQDMDFL